MSSGLDSVEGVERFSSLLYGGNKSALQVATGLGWSGVAAEMGPLLMQEVLQWSTSAYSVFFVSQTIRHLAESQLSPTDLVDLEKFLSWVIVQRHTSLSPLVVDTLVRLLCTVVKQGFCDAPDLQQFPFKVSVALMLDNSDYSEEHVALSCFILTALIDEMEHVSSGGVNIVTHQRVNTRFRNECLLPIFRAVSRRLKQLNDTQERTKYCALLLLQRVLLFDFTCSLDDETEDVLTREYPQAWVNELVDQGLLARLWELYATPTGDPRFFSAVLDTLTPLVSLKASLYPSQKVRAAWMDSILEATVSIMETRLHLDESEVLREFCRLLNRVKPNFTIDELRKSSCYERWVRAVAEFTKLCFQNWRHARQAFLSLISIWAKLVGSQSYCRDGHTLFEELAPDVCISYIMSNQDQAEHFAKNGDLVSFDDYFLDTSAEMLSLEFDFASQLLRFCGERAENYVLQEICSLMAFFKSFDSLSESEISCICERLAWVIAFASSWLCSFRFSRNELALDSSVMRACLEVTRHSCRISFSRTLSPVTCRHFHRSLLAFLRSAWSILILDRDEGKKMKEDLQNFFSLESLEAFGVFFMGLVVDEVMDCVRFCTSDTVFAALDLLNLMAVSPSTVSLMKAVPQLRDRLTLDAGVFVVSEDTVASSRVRYLLSLVEAQLFFSGPSSEGSLMEFVSPLCEKLEKCLKAGFVPGDACCAAFFDVISHWQGVFRSCIGQNEYRVLLMSVLPALPLVMQQFPAQLGSVYGLQVLRLVNEITENRCRRINFGPNSVVGYHLFRCVSGSLDAVVLVVLKAMESDELRIEEWGIKCLRILLRTGYNLLTGGYCNLGVLRLYEDQALMSCLKALWQAMLSVNRTRLSQYEKLARAFLTLSAELFRDLYSWFFSSVPIMELIGVLHLLESSLSYRSSDASFVTSLSAEALGVFANALCRAEGEDAVHCRRIRDAVLQMDRDLFSRLQRLTLDIIISKRCSSASIKLLVRSLIALDGEAFVHLAGVFSSLANPAGKNAEVRNAFVLLGTTASEGLHKSKDILFEKEYQRFSDVVKSCLC